LREGHPTLRLDFGQPQRPVGAGKNHADALAALILRLATA
jgi:hypothetical protein